MPRPNSRQLRASSVVQRMQGWSFYGSDDESDESDGSDGDAPVNELSPEEEMELREKAIKAYQAVKFPPRHKNYLLLGVHETTNEKAISLVQHGPDRGKVGTGSGLGKGRGFYVTPSKALLDLPYGECIVAVYIDNSAKPRRSLGIDNVERLEIMYATELEADPDEPCYYVMGGGGECVVPERCFDLIKVAKDLSDLG